MGHCLDKAAGMACFGLNLGGESDYCYASCYKFSTKDIFHFRNYEHQNTFFNLMKEAL